MIQYKAPTAEKDGSLLKVGNAGLNHLARSLRASRETVARGVAALGKGVAITCGTRLALNGFTVR